MNDTLVANSTINDSFIASFESFINPTANICVPYYTLLWIVFAAWELAILHHGLALYIISLCGVVKFDTGTKSHAICEMKCDTLKSIISLNITILFRLEP